MESERKPETMEVRRRQDGSLIGVGLPWDQGLFIQEHWSQGKPWYAVLSTQAEAVTIRLAEWTGAVGRVLLGPWQVGSHRVYHFEVSSLLSDQSGALVVVLRDEEHPFGLLRAPRRTIMPGLQPGVVTVEGLNGIGDRNAQFFCVQPDLYLRFGADASLWFSVPDHAGTLYWGEPQPPSGLPEVKIQEIRCSTLSVEQRDAVWEVGARRLAPAPRHALELRVRLPQGSGESMATLVGRVRTPAGAGFTIARGFPVH